MSAQEQASWFYASGKGERLGPVSFGELSSLAGQGVVGPATLVWSSGYHDWVPANEVAELFGKASLEVHEPAMAAAPAATAVPLPNLDLKPRKGLYVFPRIVMALIGSGVIGGVISGILAIMEKSPWPGLGVVVAGSALGAVATLVAYRKEHYQIHDSRVTVRHGGLLSDQTTELEVRNITHVKIKLPWLRFKFFGTGNVLIETAGTSKPVVLRLIDEPEAVYAGVRERMRRHGYDLSQKQLLHEERPALIGILGECFRFLGGASIALIFILSAVYEEQGEVNTVTFNPAVVMGLLGFAVLVVVGFVIVRFLDYRRRTYRVYDDVVVYDEGFLTRENAFIPCENLADSNTKSSFFDRIFGLCDVHVSCQGSGAEIKFRRLKHGVALSAAIDQLIARAREKQKADRSAAGRAVQDLPRRSEPEAIPAREVMVGEYGMDATRTMVPLLFLLPIFPLWIAAMIQAGIRLMSTRYSVRGGSLRHSYRFLTVHDREFACDKITGLMIKRNLWDRMFGTMTLKFWSIGSGKALEFSHVNVRQFNLPALMRQVGIPAASAEPYEAEASFSVLTWLRANLKVLPVLLLLASGIVFAATQIDETIYYLLAVPAVIGIGACLYSKVYHSHQRLRFHDHHIEAEQGIIAKRRYYVRYGNVKRSMVTRYPGGEAGSLEIFVAAEEEVQQAIQQKKSQRGSMKQVSFTTRFLPDVRDKGLLLDDILCGRVDPAPQAVAAEPLDVLLEARRAVGNALVQLVLVSILLFPMVALLPITIPVTVIRVKRWRYRIEAARIVVSWGNLYRRETSILIDRVDSQQQRQGALGKLFGNGTVSIMTAGSSKPDLKLIDSPAYLGLHEIIRERSQ